MIGNSSHLMNSHPRYGGLLLHPTSLPGKYGIGDFGPEIFRFIDLLVKANLQIWQILPLGPTGYGNSPYQSLSTYAGNPLLISPQKLAGHGLIDLKEIHAPNFPKNRIDFGKVIPFRWKILKKAYNNFNRLSRSLSGLKNRFNKFKDNHHPWLEDYSIFMSIKEDHDLRSWIEWDTPLKLRDNKALKEYREKNIGHIEFHKFVQFLFFTQWEEVRLYAQRRNIKILGDLPIFVSLDSSDVWSKPELFYLDNKGDLIYVAGVPPDYFSDTGQRWGNPIYRWDLLKKENYEWWIQRIQHTLNLVDILRIDHFRGFEAFWRIPANETTAESGKWILGPGYDFFDKLKQSLGEPIPIIAENLGYLTPTAEELLKQTGFPGMNVLQFAFFEEGEHKTKNPHLPHNFNPNTVVYTGTHDNSTTLGWFKNLGKKNRKFLLEYLESEGKDIVGDMIRLAWSSVAKISIIPFQDLLRLGDESRMNKPGSIEGNWEWRFTWNQVPNRRIEEIVKLNKLFARLG